VKNSLGFDPCSWCLVRDITEYLFIVDYIAIRYNDCDKHWTLTCSERRPVWSKWLYSCVYTCWVFSMHLY